MVTEARVEATLGVRGGGEALAQAERREASHVKFTIEEVVRLHACMSELLKERRGWGNSFTL
jgi:hypothetical protein